MHMKRVETDEHVGARPAPAATVLSAGRLVPGFTGLVAGIAALAAAAGLTGSLAVAIVTGVAVAALTGRAAAVRLAGWLDESGTSRGLELVSLVAAVVALVQLSTLAVFTLDPSRTGCSVVPWSQWEVGHSCLTAYFVAGGAADSEADIYRTGLYSLPSTSTDPAERRTPRRIGAFNVDVYEYPPPFLLLPRAVGVAAPGFIRTRMAWFGLNCAIILLAMLVTARSLGRTTGTRALLLSPLVWAALPTISTLQKGNAQLLVIAISVLAMALFERRHIRAPLDGRSRQDPHAAAPSAAAPRAAVATDAAGGLLLAFATLSKIYPGMLLLLLLAQRRWRALSWTAGAAVLLVAISFADTGRAPFDAFARHLPGLLGGEAFPALRIPAALAVNHSVPGMVLKLKLFGLAGGSFAAAKIAGWLYTLFVVWVVITLGARVGRQDASPDASPAARSQRARVWLAVLFLATLRSPFLPQTYAVFPPLWALTLVAAAAAPTGRTLAWTLLGWAALCVYVPIDLAIDPRAKALIALVPQTASLVIAVLCVRQAVPASVRNWKPALAPA